MSSKSIAQSLFKNVKIVAIGGGHGLSSLLAALKPTQAKLTGIVTVADNGGSTGRLRMETGVPAPGDIRRCILALSNAPLEVQKIFGYRFFAEQKEEMRTGDLFHHSVGNIVLTAFWMQHDQDILQAIEATSRLLQTCGTILPSTESSVTLVGEIEMPDGQYETVCGEEAIAKRAKELYVSGGRVVRVYLDPPNAKAARGVVEAIREADLILVGPGSLYTSVIPSLLPDGVVDAIRVARGKCILLSNPTHESGETNHLSAGDHFAVLANHVGKNLFDAALVNSRTPNGDAPSGDDFVLADPETFVLLGVPPIGGRWFTWFGNNGGGYNPDRLRLMVDFCLDSGPEGLDAAIKAQHDNDSQARYYEYRTDENRVVRRK